MEIFYGGKIYTMLHPNDSVEAVLIEKGRIVKIGAYEELAPLATSFHSIHGKTMFPGFVDSHLHIIGLGEKLIRLQLDHCETKEQLHIEIERALESLVPGELLVGEGWSEYNLLQEQMLTLDELDRYRDNPIILHRVCHHVLLCNRIALQIARVHAQTTDVIGGKIGRNNDNSLNGYFYDEAMSLVMNAFVMEGEKYVNYLTSCINRAVKMMHQFGLVGGHSEDCSYYGHYSNVVKAYAQSVGKHKHFRASILRHHKVFDQMMNDNIEDITGFIEYGAMKIFADGSFGGSTAALLQPYEQEGNNRGLLIHSDEQFESFIMQARRAGEAIAVHMIGDRAANQVISMIEKYPAPNGKRDRLIHCCLLTETQIERLKKLSVVLDIQPSFVSSDFPWVEQKLGNHRLHLAYAWKTLSEFPCALGTDAPIEDINPFYTIYAAVTRKKVDSDQVFNPSQCLTVFEAIKMYTYGSAFAVSKELERGLIQEGYVADFTIVDQDLLTIPSEQIINTTVLETIVDGKTVYKNNDSLFVKKEQDNLLSY